MSFLSTTATSAAALPTNFSNTSCKIQLALYAVPVGASEKKAQDSAQEATIQKIHDEEPALFEEQDCIMRTVAKERQYKQATPFKTNVSLESLADLMNDNQLCIRMSFLRPGFNSSNNVFMINSAKLQELFDSDADENGIKRVKIGFDEVISSERGFAVLAVQQKPPSNQHVAYACDFTMAETNDQQMHSMY